MLEFLMKVFQNYISLSIGAVVGALAIGFFKSGSGPDSHA